MRVHYEATRRKKTQNFNKFKNTPPNETGCMRIVIGIACVTGSRLDNTFM